MPPSTSDLDQDTQVAPRRGFLRRRQRVGPFAGGRLDFGPGPLTMHESRPDGPAMFRPRRKRLELGTLFAALVALVTVTVVGWLIYQATRVEIEARGLADGVEMTTDEAAALEVVFVFSSADRASDADLTVDGHEVDEPVLYGDGIVWAPPDDLAEGDHEIEISVPRPVFGDSVHTWTFTVDATAPELTVPAVADPVGFRDAVEVAGTAETGATVTVDDDPVDVDGDGAFRLRFDRPPAGPVRVEATDPAGNRTAASLVVPVTYPGFRGVHMTGLAWSDPELRGAVLDLVDSGRIDTIQLDLKDDTGQVVYDSEVPRAREIGAVAELYDLQAAVTAVENRGGRLVGRISAFSDPVLAGATWGAGHGGQVVQDVDGGPWDNGGGAWTNPADASVRRYNLDLAIEAVNRGVTDILWDDARLPTSEPDTLTLAGLDGSPSDAVTGFLAETHDSLRRRGAHQGVVAVGEAADKGDALGQDVARIARNADYVAPEIFPGYWGQGRHGVADPPHQPAEFTGALLTRYRQETDGTGTRLVAVLQDFTVRDLVPDDATVRAMVDAARGAGVDRFLLWDHQVRYSAGRLDPG